MATVTVNAPRTPVTKGSSGIAAATLPNVCKMPGPPAPFVPTPLPNVGHSGSSPQGYSKKVTIESQAVAITGASFGSSGDLASKATGGGLISSNTHGPTRFIGPGSMNVQIEGKNVQLLGDPMLNNCGPGGSPPNAATMTGVIQAPGVMAVIYGDDLPCGRCGKTHPLEAGPETLEMIRRLSREVRKEFERQKRKIRELTAVMSRLNPRMERRRQLADKDSNRGLSPDETREVGRLIAEITPLQLQADELMGFFRANALLRWEPDHDTYSRGYMIGVMVCRCGGKVAACSGRAPPAFARAVKSAGFSCASPPIVPQNEAPRDSWACAAKRIMDRVGKHKPIQLIERWYAPFVRGLRPSKGPKTTIMVLSEDPLTKALTVASKALDRPKSGDNVASCARCQRDLPALYCGKTC